MSDFGYVRMRAGTSKGKEKISRCLELALQVPVNKVAENRIEAPCKSNMYSYPLSRCSSSQYIGVL